MLNLHASREQPEVYCYIHAHKQTHIYASIYDKQHAYKHT